MEHSLHLGAHHFATALNIKMANSNAKVREDHLTLELGISEIANGVHDDDENLSGEFQAGDILGKILAFNGIVSDFFHAN
jgi:hypothetical protein